MPAFLHYPHYVLSDEHKKNLGFTLKFYFLIISLLTIFIEKYTNRKLYTVLINIVHRKKVKLNYVEENYTATQNDLTFYYPNKRATRMLNGIEELSEKIFNHYCLDKITFEKNDLIIDCGGNTGELYLHLEKKVPNLKYIAFEPDAKVYECLKKNIQKKGALLRSEALSNSSEEKKFYKLTENADSSLESANNVKPILVKAIQLDDFGYTSVKLLKIDAEGHELEVLSGAKKTLKEIKYISVDFGPEKGDSQERTLPEVSNYLFENNFKMIYANNLRDIGLFINKAFIN